MKKKACVARYNAWSRPNKCHVRESRARAAITILFFASSCLRHSSKHSVVLITLPLSSRLSNNYRPASSQRWVFWQLHPHLFPLIQSTFSLWWIVFKCLLRTLQSYLSSFLSFSQLNEILEKICLHFKLNNYIWNIIFVL